MTTRIFAATAPEAVGAAIAGIIVVAWAVYAVATFRTRDADEKPGVQELELAPNRKPAPNDDVMEGRRLERFLSWALILLIVSSVGPLVYWLNEPARQAGAVAEFDKIATERGRSLFLPTLSPEHGAHFGCADCHGGMEAVGGVAEYTITDYLGRQRTVQWLAPRLDTVFYKFDEDEIKAIVTYGRANTPMPAWGVAGGGPMNDQQVTDVIAYMRSIQLPPEQAMEAEREVTQAAARSSGLDPSSGEAIFQAHCARCHTKGWSYGEPELMGGGAFGPNLTNGVTLRQFPDAEDMIDFISAGSTYAQPYGTRGVGGDEGGGMPGFAMEIDGEERRLLTDEEIAAVVEYVRGL